jgi:DNA gyrase inhibitor GyrI
MKRSLWIVAMVGSATLLFVAGCNLTRFGYESPAYRVMSQEEDVEIREYPAFQVVSTPMKSADGSDGGAFRKLFDYISEGNAASQKISMTTPVLMSPQGEGGRMSFVIPKAVAAGGAPAPKSPDLQIENFAGGRYAVLRFPGQLKESNMQAAEKKVRAWAAENKVTLVGPVLVAGYDPPFTPVAMRRNEVLVKVAE